MRARSTRVGPPGTRGAAGARAWRRSRALLFFFARRVGHEAGVRGVVAALREVPAQAGLEVGAGVTLVVSAATGGVVLPNEIEHVVGERVERDHGESVGIAVIGSVE